MTILSNRLMMRTARAALACVLAAPVAGAAQRPKAAAAQPPSPSSMGLQGYSVVLVIGDMQSQPAGGEAVPGAVRKALADLQSFLPYKRYRLLDAGWMMCCAAFGSPVFGQVRGPSERDYQYTINTITSADTKLTVRFTMKEGEDTSVTAVNPAKLSDTALLEHSRQTAEAIRERDEAEIQLAKIRRQYEVGMAGASDMESASLRARRAAQRLQDLQRIAGVKTGGPSHVIMDNTFAIALGETVVIGTSRLNGDQALITLLTAATKPRPSR